MGDEKSTLLPAYCTATKVRLRVLAAVKSGEIVKF